MLVCSLWAPELPMHLARNSRFWFAVPLPSFLLWKEMDHFACLTGPPADIAGGWLLVWVDCTFYCNNLAWEPSWIGLVCSQDDAASHWHSQGRVLNTFLNLAHEIIFFFFFKSEGLSRFCLGNRDLHKCILEGCRRFTQRYMRTPCFSQVLPNLSNYLQDHKTHRMRKKWHCTVLWETNANQCLWPIHWCKSEEFSLSFLLKSSVPPDSRPAQVSQK